MFLAKALRDAKNEKFCNEFFLWELDEEVTFCRDCKKTFSVALRRHHCRNCGGVFCDECTMKDVELEGNKLDRCCKGCLRHETPGENVRVAIEKSLSIFDTRGKRKVTAYNIALNYGSAFEETTSSSPRKEPSSPRKESSSPRKDSAASGRPDAPTSGYFELVNKLGLFCCIKIVTGGDGGDVSTLWEVARPSYKAVPPNGVVHGYFDPSLPFIDVLILMGNPHSPEHDTIYDSVNNPGKVSKCAMVENFRRYLAFRVESSGRNVMLKFKGETFLEPRVGNSVGRVGILGKLGMKGEDSKDLNFETNVTSSAIRLFCASNANV